MEASRVQSRETKVIRFDRVRSILRRVSSILVFAFVSWHLVFLLDRNVMGLAKDQILQWCDEQPWWSSVGPVYTPLGKATECYEDTLGIDQGWSMFTSPVARGAPFPAIRIEFADGSTDELRSDNEPDDPVRFFRIGKARLRKFEHTLATADETDSYDDMRRSYRKPLWTQYVRWRIAVWRERHPDDSRPIKQVTSFSRRFAFPSVDDDPRELEPPTERVLARFDAKGNLVPWAR